MTKITIITPVLNGAKYISTCLQSVLRQNKTAHFESEHIIVDGGSTDGTIEIVKNSYPHAKLIVGRDRGMYDAINRGISRSSGSILCYLNADDLFLPNALSHVTSAALHFPDADFFFGHSILFGKNNDSFWVRPVRAMKDARPWTTNLRRIPFFQQSSFWRRRIIKSNEQFANNLRFVGDSLFFYELIVKNHIRCCRIDKYLGCFRSHNLALSHALKDKMRTEHNTVFEKTLMRNTWDINRVIAEATWRLLNLRYSSALLTKRI